VRDAETTVSSARIVAWPRRLAMAAAVAMAVFGATLVYRVDAPTRVADRQSRLSGQAGLPVRHQTLVTKPIVESYQSDNATIVEVPTEESDDVKIVMIFDENLPADL